MANNARTGGYGGMLSGDPAVVRDEQLKVMLAELNNPRYAQDVPALSREIQRLGGTLPTAQPTPEEPAPGAQLVGAMGSPEANAAIAESQGPLSQTSGVPSLAPAFALPEGGALSQVAQAQPEVMPNQGIDLNAMIQRLMPQDDSRSHYLALAAGFGAPTKTGSFGEQLGNVAASMQQQKSEQEKLRAQYIPHIMQQVAAQQARADNQAYQAQQAMQANQWRQQAADEQRSYGAQQAELTRQQTAERALADRASREQIAAESAATRKEIAQGRLDQLAGNDKPKLKQGERWNADTQTVEAIPGSDLYQKQKSAHAKDFGTVQNITSSMDNSIAKVSEILDPKNTSGFNSNFGGYNALATQFFDSDMRRKIESLKSDLKVAGLNIIRAGGSVGAMTEKEWPIVEGLIANISPTLSEPEARDQLSKIAARMEAIKRNAQTVYQTEWGGSPYFKPEVAGAPPAAAPAQSGGWSIKPKGQ